MKEIFFLLKMVGLSIVVALVLQVKVGENTTAEQQFHGWLKSSFAVEWIQVAVDGGFAIAKTGYTATKRTLDPLLARLHRKHDGEADSENERSAGKFFSIKRKKPKPGEDEEMP